MRQIIFLVITLLISACGTVNSTDTEATLQSQNQAYATQIAGAPPSIEQNATRAWATVGAAETNAAEVRNINGQLLATLAVNAPPTGTVRQQSGPPASAPLSTPGSIEQGAAGTFILNGVGTAVRQSDGCLIDARSSFETALDEIFVGLEAVNIAAGVPIRAEWYRGANMVYQFEWQVDRDYSRICVWFSLTQADAAFVAGGWSVQLFANGQQINGAINFTFEDMMDMTDG